MAAATRQTRALADRLAANLLQRCGVRDSERLLVAVSGGADSTALLALLAAIAPRLHLELEVAHFDHALRDESAADAASVVERARELGLPCHIARWETPRPNEAAARAARFAWLESTAGARNCDAIALAHHLDDQIETVLLRLGRGAGLRGWLGMAWRRAGRVTIVRPLLDQRHATLVAHLGAIGWDWREDATNRDLRLARNRIRIDVVPALDTALPAGWRERWGASLGDLRSVWRSLDRRAGRLLEAARCTGAPESLDLATLQRAPAIERRQALALWLGAAREGGPSRRHLAAAARMLRDGRSGRTLDLPGGWRLAREQERITLLPPPAIGRRDPRPGDEQTTSVAKTPGSGTPETRPGATVAAVDTPGLFAVAEMDGGAAWAAVERQLQRKSPGECDLPQVSETEECAWIDPSAVVSKLTLRLARTGDRVRLLGAPGSRSVRRILQDRGIPVRERSAWPVVEDDAGIVWLPGIGVAERVRLGPKTPRGLHLRFAASPGGVAAAAPEP